MYVTLGVVAGLILMAGADRFAVDYPRLRAAGFEALALAVVLWAGVAILGSAVAVGLRGTAPGAGFLGGVLVFGIPALAALMLRRRRARR